MTRRRRLPSVPAPRLLFATSRYTGTLRSRWFNVNILFRHQSTFYCSVRRKQNVDNVRVIQLKYETKHCFKNNMHVILLGLFLRSRLYKQVTFSKPTAGNWRRRARRRRGRGWRLIRACVEHDSTFIFLVLRNHDTFMYFILFNTSKKSWQCYRAIVAGTSCDAAEAWNDTLF